MRRHLATTVFAAVAVVAVWTGTGASALAEPSGRILALSCFSCHGPAGKSPDSIPGIHGKSASFIAREMRAFRSGARRSTVMGRISKGYTDAQIKSLANHLATMK